MTFECTWHDPFNENVEECWREMGQPCRTQAVVWNHLTVVLLTTTALLASACSCSMRCIRFRQMLSIY